MKYDSWLRRCGGKGEEWLLQERGLRNDNGEYKIIEVCAFVRAWFNRKISRQTNREAARQLPTDQTDRQTDIKVSALYF